MALESASFISGLVSANPPGTDAISQGDDHLRLIKTVLKASLPNADAAINGIHTKATAPSSTSAGQLWFDTTLNLVKIRNEADDGWITLLASEGARVLDVLHGTSTSSTRPAANDTYENSGMTIAPVKISSTSNLYIHFDCFMNIACDFSAVLDARMLGYLGGSDASPSTIIGGTTADLELIVFDSPVGHSGSYDASNTFSRTFKVTAANCPSGGGTTGTQTFNWVYKMVNRDQMTVTNAASWMVWEVEE